MKRKFKDYFSSEISLHLKSLLDDSSPYFLIKNITNKQVEEWDNSVHKTKC